MAIQPFGGHMKVMRILLASAVLATAAAPAAAQLLSPSDQMQLQMLQMQQAQAERRAIDQANQFEALSARQRADQAALDLRLQRDEVGRPPVPALRYPNGTDQAPPAAARYPSIPDAALADSNRRVQAAAANRP